MHLIDVHIIVWVEFNVSPVRHWSAKGTSYHGKSMVSPYEHGLMASLYFLAQPELFVLNLILVNSILPL